jgi:hypothetical protein
MKKGKIVPQGTNKQGFKTVKLNQNKTYQV